MKHFFLLTLIFLSTSILAQKFEKSKDPYIAKNGTVYKVGDTISIASPTDFSNEFTCFVQGNKLESKMQALYTVKGKDGTRTYDRRNTRYTIKQFKIFEEHGTYAVVDNMFNYMVNIDLGLEMNEVFSKEMEDMIIDRIPEIFTDSIAFLHYLKRQGEVNENSVKEFLYVFDNPTYKNVRNDEFAFHEQLSKTKKQLNEAVVNIIEDKTYFLGFEDKIGNYNFDTSSFPILWEKNGGVMLDDFWELLAKDNLSGQIDLTDLRIFFTNTEDFPEMLLNPDRARFLINHRKAANGNIDRKIHMGIQFKITELVNADHFQ
ncbi:MAG: DUF4852 domain-containing protein, partial [Bacteroidales bacterium]|nr:DUF4852 domain-containing protein [Bacteroidales bacterium]